MGNPVGPTRFDSTLLDLSNLEAFAPIVFDAHPSPFVSLLKLMPTEINVTEECHEYNKFTFCNIDHFDSNDMTDSLIYLKNTVGNATKDSFLVNFTVSASSLPRVPFHLPVVLADIDDPVFLPNFGLEKSAEKIIKPTGLPVSLRDSTNFDLDEITREAPESEEKDSLNLPLVRKISLDEDGAYDSSSSEVDKEE